MKNWRNAPEFVICEGSRLILNLTNFAQSGY